MINNPIILVDGSFYIHRAYHAFPLFTTSSGKPVWVIYGVISMLRSLLIQYRPTYMAVILDAGGKTFRDELFPQYKANRTKMPKDLCIQIDSLCVAVEAMGISVLKVPYVEADDVIGTLATFYAELGNTVLISTGDKDMAQIVSSKIVLFNAKLNIILDIAEVKRKFGVAPALIADYLALIGDRSDNIPGVPGIGKKTAQILLTKIGNLEVLYKNLNDVDSLGLRRGLAMKNILFLNKEMALLSYKLATIKTDVFLKKSDYQLSIRQMDVSSLLTLFKKCEFKKWFVELQSGQWLSTYRSDMKLLNNSFVSNSNILFIKKEDIMLDDDFKNKMVDIICDVKTLCYWVNKINVASLIVFHICTDTSNIFSASMISLCFSVCSDKNVYIPIKNNILDDNVIMDCLSIEEVLCFLKPILENPKIAKISQNLKFVYALLRRYNIDLSGIIFDVLLEFYILYGTFDYQEIKNFLKKDELNAFMIFKKSFDNCNNFCLSNAHDLKLQSIHASKLINSIYKLHEILWINIQRDIKLKTIFEEIEIPLIFILARIESYGVLIDRNLLTVHSMELDYRLNKLKVEAYRLADVSFNLASTKQLQDILYERQKLPILRKTPNGFPSTNEEVLKKLAKKYPMPRIILEYRSLYKLKSTYTSKLIAMINEKSNRIHTSYNQTRTSTGRLSSNNPNLQNIPSKNHDGRRIRQAFIAPTNFLILSADYSQIELRIMAHLSRDLNLIDDFILGKDIHASTASEIFVTSVNLVTHEQRNKAKTVNFGLIYGMSAFGLARQLSVTCKEAQRYVDRYFKRYPGIMEYMEKIKYYVNRYGYVLTLEGRKLYFPNIYSSNIFLKKSAERAAINAPIQGSAADIIKRAMISIDSWFRKDTVPARMIMQVHDELVFEVQSNVIDFVSKQIKKLMEECFILDIPLKVDIGIGKNWEQAH